MRTIYHQDMHMCTERSSEQIVWEHMGLCSSTCTPEWNLSLLSTTRPPLPPKHPEPQRGSSRRGAAIPHHAAMPCQSCLRLRSVTDNTSRLIRELTAPEKNPWLLSSARENGDNAELSGAEGRRWPCWLTSIPYRFFTLCWYLFASPFPPLLAFAL